MSQVTSRLSAEQQKKLLSLLGHVRLHLLYKATVHGFNGRSFHNYSNYQGPTVIVAYNAAGFVYGAYTSQDYTDRSEDVTDTAAFLYSILPNQDKVLKATGIAGQCAFTNNGQTGPNFGALVFLNGNNPGIASYPGTRFQFEAEEMHGNDLALTELEVYRAEALGTRLLKPWRKIEWTTQRQQTLKKAIESYKPEINVVKQAKVLLIGPVGAGKSSFFNSINSTFRGNMTCQAIAGTADRSVTNQFRAYTIKAKRGGQALPLVLCDTMGLEEMADTGLDLEDLINIYQGHVKDRYQFNPLAPIRPDSPGFRKDATVADKIHCVVYVIDACKASLLSQKMVDKFAAIRKKTNLLGIPQLLLMTKVDEACPLVAEDIRNVYHSVYIQKTARELSESLGIPLSCILPVKNYCDLLELDQDTDILLFSAIEQMLNFADSFFENEEVVESARPTIRNKLKSSINSFEITFCTYFTAKAMSQVTSSLSSEQQKKLLSLLGHVRLHLLHKATVHGFTVESFHNHCNYQGPTVIVAYNAAGFVYGAYTSQDHTEKAEDVNDTTAFLYSIPPNQNKPLKVSGISGQCAFTNGVAEPNFGALVFLHGNEAKIQSNPGTHFQFEAGAMHGNDLALTELEVYRAEVLGTLLLKPWRNIEWTKQRWQTLKDTIENYKPDINVVKQARVLLVGPVGAGKSSFFNSINSAFRGNMTCQAIAGTADRSVTNQFRTYTIKAKRGGQALPLVLCDTMGLEEMADTGLDIEDLISIYQGHVKDRYQFSPLTPILPNSPGYRKHTTLADKIHCVVYVIDARKASIISQKMVDKFAAIRKKTNHLGLPQIVLMTKVDEACPLVAEDIKNVYHSVYIQMKARELSESLGIPLSCILPVKNYCDLLELDQNMDILLFSAVQQMLNFADSFFENEEVEEQQGGEDLYGDGVRPTLPRNDDQRIV